MCEGGSGCSESVRYEIYLSHYNKEFRLYIFFFIEQRDNIKALPF